MSGMDNLVTWLRAQIDARERELDEDERVAREAEAEDKPPWHYKPGDFGKIRSADGYTVVHVEDSTPGPPTAEHIARWDPARVLREVETGRAEVDATRRILELRDAEVADIGHEDYEISTAAATSAGVLDDVIKLLALPYAGRDGYQESWRP